MECRQTMPQFTQRVNERKRKIICFLFLKMLFEMQKIFLCLEAEILESMEDNAAQIDAIDPIFKLQIARVSNYIN